MKNWRNTEVPASVYITTELLLKVTKSTLHNRQDSNAFLSGNTQNTRPTTEGRMCARPRIQDAALRFSRTTNFTNDSRGKNGPREDIG